MGNGGGGGAGGWFPAYGNVTCIDKGVKIYSTKQKTRINSYDDFIGGLEVLVL